MNEWLSDEVFTGQHEETNLCWNRLQLKIVVREDIQGFRVAFRVFRITARGESMLLLMGYVYREGGVTVTLDTLADLVDFTEVVSEEKYIDVWRSLARVAAEVFTLDESEDEEE